MALFGKKKKAEAAAPPIEEQDEIQVVGGDADEMGADNDDDGGQAIDFDAIAADLEDDDGESALGEPLGEPLNGAPATAATPTDDFGSTADFSSNNSGNAGLDADDDLDFDSVFNDGSPAPDAVATNAVATDASEADANPFGGASNLSSDPINGGLAIEPTSDTPPLTYTAPLLTSDAVAQSGVPATRKSLPLPLILGALGLLIALGAVGYFVTQGDSTPDEEPIAVVATNPATPDTALAPGAGAGAAAGGADVVNLGAVVDGVPIASGANRGIAPALVSGRSVSARPTVPLTPQLQKQLKDLWNKGAVAKRRDDFVGARAAWTEMLRKRPNHPGIQSAIDKLPPA